MSSAAQFVGSIPELYDRYLGPLLFEPYAVDLARRLALAPGARVLELACGTGRLTRHLLERLPAGGLIVATDLNEPMLERARESISDPRIVWQQADACALPFEDHRFESAVCQFGVMFFPDKLQAAREVRRVLVPGGEYRFNVWDSPETNALGRIADRTIAGFFTSDPPPFYRVPFGYYDTDEIRDTLRTAGFDPIAIETVPMMGESLSAEDAASGIVRGNPVILDIRERGTSDVAEIEAAVAQALRAECGDRPLRLPMQAHVVCARNPK